VRGKFYRVTIGGDDWYYGSSPSNAIQHISDALAGGRGPELAVKIENAPQPGIKVQCCAGVGFHDSDCFFARDFGAVNQQEKA
jgi:hypothetical protein